MAKLWYPAFFTEAGGEPCLTFYDFNLVICRPTKTELASAIQPMFENFMREIQRDGIPLPLPTPINLVDPRRFSGILTQIDLDIGMSEAEARRIIAKTTNSATVPPLSPILAQRLLNGELCLEEDMDFLIENFDKNKKI